MRTDTHRHCAVNISCAWGGFGEVRSACGTVETEGFGERRATRSLRERAETRAESLSEARGPRLRASASLYCFYVSAPSDFIQPSGCFDGE